ncbi:MAG: hypothetical protein JWO89_914 [Verrucomicrobiaceae bacterium]|nr:hypothetical protein [Verrucomicrobiaceae bacterium]
MNTLETDVEVAADGSLKLLSPLPDWLKPGRTHMLLMVTGTEAPAPKAKREIPTATPETIAQRLAAFEGLRKLNPYRDIADPVAWQQEIREDVVLPGRE